MEKLPIVKFPDQKLNHKAKPVVVFDEELRKFSENLVYTMFQNNGIGIAANQVGDPRSLLAIRILDEGNTNALVMVNPKIVWSSEELLSRPEGCLSFPDLLEMVSRAESIKVEYQTLEGIPSHLEADGIKAVQIQHEVDHLQGLTLMNKVSRLKRNLIFKRLKKLGYV